MKRGESAKKEEMVRRKCKAEEKAEMETEEYTERKERKAEETEQAKERRKRKAEETEQMREVSKGKAEEKAEMETEEYTEEVLTGPKKRKTKPKGFKGTQEGRLGLEHFIDNAQLPSRVCCASLRKRI